jgi:hypothetical protein
VLPGKWYMLQLTMVSLTLSSTRAPCPVTRCHVTCDTSPVTRHTSHVTRHAPQVQASITALLNGAHLVTVADSSCSFGNVAVGSGWHAGQSRRARSLAPACDVFPAPLKHTSPFHTQRRKSCVVCVCALAHPHSRCSVVG